MVGRDLVVSSRLRRAAARVREAGAVITIATGRMLCSARPFSLKLGANGPAICYQGAMTFLPGDGRIVRHWCLELESARDTLALLEGTGAHVNVYIDDEIYVTGINEWAERYAERMAVRLKIVDSLLPLAEQRPTLILAVMEPEEMEPLVVRIRAGLGDSAKVTRSLAHFCEIGSREAGKDRAVAAIADSMGIGPEKVVAFGDGEGDAEMLEWAGLGVAVEGGHPDVLASGDSTIPGPGEDGVAKLLEDLLARSMIGP